MAASRRRSTACRAAIVWLTVGLREGKNREVKRVLAHLGLDTNRLIRISYGPFQLGDLTDGEVREIRGRVLRDQLGAKLARSRRRRFRGADPASRRRRREAKPAPARSRRSAEASRPRAHRRR